MTIPILFAEALVAAVALVAVFLVAPRLKRLRAKVLLVVWVSFGAAVAGDRPIGRPAPGGGVRRK